MDDWLDRAEDTIQNNRNAFNESYPETLNNYIYIWRKLEIGIGKDWFKTPFGEFMKKYLFDKIKFKTDIHFKIKLLSDIEKAFKKDTRIIYPQELIIKSPPPVIKNKELFDDDTLFTKLITGENILDYVLKFVEQLFSFKPLDINLWYVKEKDWSSQKEIINLVTYL